MATTTTDQTYRFEATIVLERAHSSMGPTRFIHSQATSIESISPMRRATVQTPTKPPVNMAVNTSVGSNSISPAANSPIQMSVRRMPTSQPANQPRLPHRQTQYQPPRSPMAASQPTPTTRVKPSGHHWRSVGLSVIAFEISNETSTVLVPNSTISRPHSP
jgi:hypothetical protein